LTPPVVGADFLAALVASCFLGALPPVDLRAVCLVRAIESESEKKEEGESEEEEGLLGFGSVVIGTKKL
jgi:hypothetical protein